MNDGTTTIVAGVQSRWRAAFAARDWDAILWLYDENALFFGSAPALCAAPADIRAYFEHLPTGIALIDFPPLTARAAAPGVIVASGFWRFDLEGKSLDFRLAWTLAERHGVWRIVQHHAALTPQAKL